MIITWTGKAISENIRLETGYMRWHMTAKYRTFLTSMIWTLKVAWGRKEQLKKPVRLKISTWLNPRMDMLNIDKPCADAIEKAGIIANDNQIWDFRMDRAERHGKEDIVMFDIEEIEASKLSAKAKIMAEIEKKLRQT